MAGVVIECDPGKYGPLARKCSAMGCISVSRTAEDRIDPGQKLARIEGLGQIIICTGVEPLDPSVIVAERRQHENRRLLLLPAQPCAGREPVLSRHHDIEHDQIEFVLAQSCIHLARAFGPRRAQPVFLQVARHGVPDLGMIIDDQNMRRCRHQRSGPTHRHVWPIGLLFNRSSSITPRIDCSFGKDPHLVCRNMYQ